jgi:hypothetical protein
VIGGLSLGLAALLAAAGQPPVAPARAPAASALAPPGSDLPNVPGATNPVVTQEKIATTICKSGWTKTIRPPASKTNRIKKELMARYHLPGKLSDYELDHLISLEIGGNPIDPDNLWMEHWADPWGARTKDALETKLKRLVCAGTITLAEAQQAISGNWVEAYPHYVTAKAAGAAKARTSARRPAHSVRARRGGSR